MTPAARCTDRVTAWRRGGFGRRAAAAVICAFAALAVAAPSPAAADEQPPILKAYNLDWIERVREEAWPQPKAQRPVICLLDTGVNVTPDTPADDPNGPIVARLALDGGTGEAQGDAWEHGHGTQMASVIAAPRNGWGTVGVFPQARIVSVRVTVGSALHIVPADIVRGVNRCWQWSTEAAVPVGVIVLAESLYDQRVSDLARWEHASRLTRDLGANFVAAVGNDQNAQQVAPVAVSNVVAVSAADESGALCGFAPAVVNTLLGPGCATGSEWVPGSSSAAAAVGAVSAALATRSMLSANERWAALRDSAVVNASGESRIDGRAIADRFFAGFVDVPAAEAPSNGLSIVPDGAAAVGRPRTQLKLWKPRLVAMAHKGKLLVKRLNRKRTGRLVLEMTMGKKVRRLSTRRTHIAVRVPKRVTRIRAWVESIDPGRWRSLTTRLAVDR